MNINYVIKILLLVKLLHIIFFFYNKMLHVNFAMYEKLFV
jgi:hypothetical protein